MKLISLLTPTEPQFNNAVHEVLKRPEYKILQERITDFIDSIKERIMKLIFKALIKLFSNIPKAHAASEKLSNIFMIIGIVLILAVIIVLVIKISGGFEKKHKMLEILGEKIDEKTTPSMLRKKAEEYVKNEDFRQAIRYDFIALLLLMHERNILFLDEAKTNEENYDYLKKNNFDKLDIFRRLINSFNSSWYGHKGLNLSIYDEWKGNVKTIWDEVITSEEKNK